jgi:hypothetical protein
LKICISSHQTVEQQRINSLRLRVCANARIEIRRAALDEKDDGMRVALR